MSAGPKLQPVPPSGPDPSLAKVIDLQRRDGLRVNDRLKPIPCLENVVSILQRHGAWQGVLAFNEFSLAMEKKRPPPFEQPAAGEWSDADDDELDLWLSKEYDMRAGRETCARAAGIVARRNAYNPVREYLDGLLWDGRDRLSSWLHDYVGARVPDGDIRTPDYYAKAGRWWLISAVARIYRPGCKADHVLLLEGEQGVGKSTVFATLFGEWFSDTPLRIGDKDSYGALRGVWCYELAELDSLNRAESSASKAFFSSSRDKYRPPYGKRDIVAQRQVVFAGTVNHDQYLKDSTGNRRYWPVRTGAELRISGIDSIESDRDQLFAEAVVRYRSGEKWHPETREDKALFKEQQDQREVGDVYEALIEDGTAGLSEVSMVAIFKEILDIEPAKMTRAEQTRVGEAMRRLGWAKKRVGSRAMRSYVYVRSPESVDEARAEAGDVPF